jgi:hypothetical protein
MQIVQSKIEPEHDIQACPFRLAKKEEIESIAALSLEA